MIPLPNNRCVLLIAGNLQAVRHAVTEVVLPKVDERLSAAGLAQLLNAALTLEVVPKIAQVKGRVELIVAGIDPIRHIEEPSLYYMDSAQDFHLQIPPGDVAVAGSTAAVTSLLAGHSYANSSVDHLLVLAKECLGATKLRWPEAVGNHIKLAVITPQTTHLQAL